jgi:thiol-disulfide isomerase/thioredoxin
MSKRPSGSARPARPANHTAHNKRRATSRSAQNQGGGTPVTTGSGFVRFRRAHPILGALVPVGLVLLALVALVVVKTTSGPANAQPSVSKVAPGSAGAGAETGTSALPSGVLSAVTSISGTTFAAIGDPSGVSAPTATPKNTSTLDATDGKPEILYVGAEFCPYCAAERWALVVALSRFGTFSGLQATHSADGDIYPDTKTFSFYGSTYTSPDFDFVPVEEQTNQMVDGSYTTLQTPTASEDAVLAKYDTTPYTSEPGSIPFLDIANKFVSIGASYTPQVLQGLSMQTIAEQLNDKNSAVATAIDGAANQITAAITAATGAQPTTMAATGSTGS